MANVNHTAICNNPNLLYETEHVSVEQSSLDSNVQPTIYTHHQANNSTIVGDIKSGLLSTNSCKPKWQLSLVSNDKFTRIRAYFEDLIAEIRRVQAIDNYFLMKRFFYQLQNGYHDNEIREHKYITPMGQNNLFYYQNYPSAHPNHQYLSNKMMNFSINNNSVAPKIYQISNEKKYQKSENYLEPVFKNNKSVSSDCNFLSEAEDQILILTNTKQSVFNVTTDYKSVYMSAGRKLTTWNFNKFSYNKSCQKTKEYCNTNSNRKHNESLKVDEHTTNNQLREQRISSLLAHIDTTSCVSKNQQWENSNSLSANVLSEIFDKYAYRKRTYAEILSQLLNNKSPDGAALFPKKFKIGNFDNCSLRNSSRTHIVENHNISLPTCSFYKPSKKYEPVRFDR